VQGQSHLLGSRLIHRKYAHAVLALAIVAVCFAQGTSTRNAAPGPKQGPSGRPFPVSFVDVAEQAGLHMRFTSGNEQSKKYIIEANGSGVAFLDYDRDGRQDIFLVNGSRLEGFPQGEAPTNHLYRNEGDGRRYPCTVRTV
jgi:enediyne biosynthesis protein E4